MRGHPVAQMALFLSFFFDLKGFPLPREATVICSFHDFHEYEICLQNLINTLNAH